MLFIALHFMFCKNKRKINQNSDRRMEFCREDRKKKSKDDVKYEVQNDVTRQLLSCPQIALRFDCTETGDVGGRGEKEISRETLKETKRDRKREKDGME